MKPFSNVWAVQDVFLQYVLKISAILLKYLTFEDVFSYFHGQNRFKIRFSAHCSVLTKKLINTKVRKRLILKIKMYFQL